MPNVSLIGEDCLKCKGTRAGRVTRGLEARGTVVDTEWRKVSERPPSSSRRGRPRLNRMKRSTRALLKTARAEAAHAVFRMELMWLVFD
jgi:hypothetical protein